MYYLSSVQAVKQEIRKRQNERGTIHAMLDGHIEREFGVADFSKFVAKQILGSVVGPSLEDTSNTTYGVLARQVPGVCIEDIACYMLSLRSGIQPLALAFTRDVFHSGSNDKLFRLKVPFCSWSKKGNLAVNYKSVATNMNGHSFTDFDMIRLDKFRVGECSLPEYHRSMQQSVFAQRQVPYLWGDISSTWGEIVAQAKEVRKHPQTIWRHNEEGRDMQWTGDYTAQDARSLLVRPSSKWYYHLYLSMFLDGKFVLLETYDNEAGGVPEARRLFEKEMDAIKQATGYMPLVVKTWPLRPDMLYINQHIIDNPLSAVDSISQRNYWHDETTSMVRWYADQAIQFRG